MLLIDERGWSKKCGGGEGGSDVCQTGNAGESDIGRSLRLRDNFQKKPQSPVRLSGERLLSRELENFPRNFHVEIYISRVIESQIVKRATTLTQ